TRGMIGFAAKMAIFTAWLILRLGEWRAHAVNVRFLRQEGAKEVASKLVRCYLMAEWVAIGICFVEYFLIPKRTAVWQEILGVLLMIAAGLLRSWARQALGQMWSLRLFYIPGVERVDTGPYRYFGHPEYLSRFVEILGLSLVVGSYYGFAVYVGLVLLILP